MNFIIDQLIININQYSPLYLSLRLSIKKIVKPIIGLYHLCYQIILFKVMLQIPGISQCKVCYKKTDLTCTLCQNTFYCCKQHQKKDWKNHKAFCQGYYAKSTLNSQNLILKKQKSMQLAEPQYKIVINLSKSGDIRQHLKQSKPIQKVLFTRTPQLEMRYSIFKKQIINRQQERKNTLFCYLNEQYKNALYFVKRLILKSKNILEETNQQTYLEYERKDNIRTNRILQEYELLNDHIIWCKINHKQNKIEQIKKIIRNLNFPKIRKMDYKKKPQNKNQMLELNQWREELTIYSCILKELILITVDLNLIENAQQLYLKYLELIKTTSGDIDLATAYFQFANFYIKSKNPNSAYRYFLKCKAIRQQYGQTLALADVIMNIGLIYFYLNNENDKLESIQMIKNALRIRRAKGESQLIIAGSLESLGKMYLSMGNPQKSLQCLIECFQIRQQKLAKNDKQLKRVEVLIVFLYNTINQKIQSCGDPGEKQLYTNLISKIQDEVFIESQFSDYSIKNLKDINSIKSQLTLKFDQGFFQMLQSTEILQFKEILENLEKLSYKKGIQYFSQSKFYKNLSISKIIHLESMNEDIKVIRALDFTFLMESIIQL